LLAGFAIASCFKRHVANKCGFWPIPDRETILLLSLGTFRGPCRIHKQQTKRKHRVSEVSNMQNLFQPQAISSRKSLFAAGLASLALAGLALSGSAQLPISSPQAAPPTAPSSSFSGSVASDKPTADVLQLTLDEAVQRGLKTNLGLLLSTTQIAQSRGERLQSLQSLLPSIDANLKEAFVQSDLAAQGLRIPGIPSVIGPFGYQDARGNLTWTVVSLNSLKNYMASRHYFQSSQLSAEDSRQLIILTVGNAYLKVLADEAQIAAIDAEVNASGESLRQASNNHEAGTAPLLDELRAKVDLQSLQQQSISARNAREKDLLSLARIIGLPLGQKFEVADKVPYSAFDQPDIQTAIKQALDNRKDRQASAENTKAAEDQRKAATYDRLPTVKAEADYGAIGTNLRTSHGTVDATGTLTIPIFKEAQFRGEATVAQSKLDQQKDQQSDLDAQIEADVRDALFDIASSQQQVEVSKSNVDLSSEVLSEAQQRYAAGVSDNLAVSDALQSVAQANGQYVNSLYQHNVAKLNLARAMGVAQNYKEYLGGK
jgi:outer membrane protein TolC